MAFSNGDSHLCWYIRKSRRDKERKDCFNSPISSYISLMVSRSLRPRARRVLTYAGTFPEFFSSFCLNYFCLYYKCKLTIIFVSKFEVNRGETREEISACMRACVCAAGMCVHASARMCVCASETARMCVSMLARLHACVRICAVSARVCARVA